MDNTIWDGLDSKEADSETVQNVKRAIDAYGLYSFDRAMNDILGMLSSDPTEMRRSERWQSVSLIKYAYTAIRRRLLEDGDVENDYEKR